MQWEVVGIIEEIRLRGRGKYNGRRRANRI